MNSPTSIPRTLGRSAGYHVLLALLWVPLVFAADPSAAPAASQAHPESLLGQPADLAPSAYLYRANRKAEENPPEAWILLMQFAQLPLDRPVEVSAPAIRKVLCGLLWEEVRPVRQVELSWSSGTQKRPAPEELSLSYFDATDDTAHTWWNPRKIKEAGKPEISPDGHTYIYTIPIDSW